MSLDVDAEILEEEYFESIENKLGIKVTNSLRDENDEEPLEMKN
jgi:hypothetical protein